MTNVIYAKKLGMGEVYSGDVRLGATKIKLYPMTITQLKTQDKDGYTAAQVGFDTPKKHSRNKYGKTREIEMVETMHLGDSISPADLVKVGSVCDIQGTSKGKGFAGVVKRWNFAGGPRTHGQSDRLRAPGSIGQGTTPGRVHKGKRMAGRMGSDTVTVKKSRVVSFDPSTNIAWVTGPVPGSMGSLIRLTLVSEQVMPELKYITGGLPAAPVITEEQSLATN